MLCSNMCRDADYALRPLLRWCLYRMPMVSAYDIPILSRIYLSLGCKHLCYVVMRHSLQPKAMAITDVLDYFDANSTNIHNADNWRIGHSVCDARDDKHNGIEKTPLRLLDCFVYNNKRILKLQLGYPFALLHSWFHH